MVIALPVFAGGECVAWAASIAHWNDVGGKIPGSMAVDVTEIFQEGLRLPAVKLFEQAADRAVFDIITANSRLPDFVRGDLWAQVAASRKAEAAHPPTGRHLRPRCLSRRDPRAVRGRRAARTRRTWPRCRTARFRIEEEQDDGAIWHAGITISPSASRVDLSDNPRQRDAPYNTSRDGAVISGQMIFKALTDPTLFANAGSFRALEVITGPGTIFHAEGSVPHGYYFETRIRLYDMLWRCMAQVLPERLPAGHFGSICGTVIAGDHPDTGRRFTMVEPQMGGWGATATRDGLDAMYSASHGDTFNCPVEICEARYGIDVGYKRLNETAEGSGLHHGGKGLSVSYRPRGRAVLSAGFSRNRQPVWGLLAARWRHQRALGRSPGRIARGPCLRQRTCRRARRRDRHRHGQWRRLGPPGLNRGPALFRDPAHSCASRRNARCRGLDEPGRLDQEAFRRLCRLRAGRCRCRAAAGSPRRSGRRRDASSRHTSTSIAVPPPLTDRTRPGFGTDWPASA